MVEVQVDGLSAIYAITSLPTREDDEDLAEYCARTGQDLHQPHVAGLSNEVIVLADKLGWQLQINDCPGCENEAMFYKD